MQMRPLFKPRRWGVVDGILFTLTIIFLWGCDCTIGCGEATQDEKPLIPDSSWDCGMPDGIPSPELGELVFTAEMTLNNIYDMGQTQYGHRHLIEIEGGEVSGPYFTADILTGGLDYQLTLSNNAMEIEQVNVLQTSDGEYIYMRTCGASAAKSDVRIVPEFEAPSSSDYSYLNSGKFVGTRVLNKNKKTMTLKVYEVSNVDVDPSVTGAIEVVQPDDAPDQSWDCQEASSSETKGNELLNATVTLDTTITVGESKYGARYIAPITGGTFTGDITGSVLFGGADYQLYTGETTADIVLDARYTLEADDGELIIVRNCGPVTMLAPSFETRSNGNYSYLNDNRWLSSFPIPNDDQTAVNLTFYESN